VVCRTTARQREHQSAEHDRREGQELPHQRPRLRRADLEHLVARDAERVAASVKVQTRSVAS